MFQPHNQTEKRSLTRTVGTDDAHDTVGWKHEIQVIEQYLIAKSLLHVLRFDNLVTQTRTVRNEDFQLFLFLLLILVKQFVV